MELRSASLQRYAGTAWRGAAASPSADILSQQCAFPRKHLRGLHCPVRTLPVVSAGTHERMPPVAVAFEVQPMEEL